PPIERKNLEPSIATVHSTRCGPAALMDPRLQQLQESITAAVDGMTPQQLTWALPQKWSIAQVLEHLLLTYRGTALACERCLGTGKLLAKSSPTLRQRLQVWVIVNFKYMPRGREAPERSRPKGLPPETVLAELTAKLGTVDELLTWCEQRFGATV